MHAGSAASAATASEFTQDGASTFSPSHCTWEDESSDWDRFSDDGAETTSSTGPSDGSGPASQVTSEVVILHAGLMPPTLYVPNLPDKHNMQLVGHSMVVG